MLNRVSKNPWAFYSYTLKESDRPDKISNQYYGSFEYSWLVYLSNEIIDPYYGWFLDSDKFETMLRKVYGGQDIADRHIINYRVNWDEDPSIIEPSTYNAFPDAIKKYWTPNYSSSGNIQSYERDKHDWNATTNYYHNVKLANTSGFEIDDLIQTKLNGSTVSMSQVYSVNSTSITIQHIVGNPSRLVSFGVSQANTMTIGETASVTNGTSNTTGTIYFNSNSSIILTINNTIPVGNLTITDDASNNIVITTNTAYDDTTLYNDTKASNAYSFVYSETLANCIPFEERVYWSPFTSFESEAEDNARRKHIRLLDSAHKQTAAIDLKNLMRN